MNCSSDESLRVKWKQLVQRINIMNQLRFKNEVNSTNWWRFITGVCVDPYLARKSFEISIKANTNGKRGKLWQLSTSRIRIYFRVIKLPSNLWLIVEIGTSSFMFHGQLLLELLPRVLRYNDYVQMFTFCRNSFHFHNFLRFINHFIAISSEIYKSETSFTILPSRCRIAINV